jgi:hypothetical protein
LLIGTVIATNQLRLSGHGLADHEERKTRGQQRNDTHRHPHSDKNTERGGDEKPEKMIVFLPIRTDGRPTHQRIFFKKKTTLTPGGDVVFLF